MSQTSPSPASQAVASQPDGNPLANRIGPYHYAAGDLREKTFQSPQPGAEPRRFLVLVSSAYNAYGLIGPEHNGLVIIDADSERIVLDKHLTSSFTSAPSPKQRAELDRLMGLDWAAFTDFIRSHPRYRGGMPDIDAAEPNPGRPLPPETVLVTPEFRAEIKAKYNVDLPLTTRREIVDWTLKHEFHRIGNAYSPWAFSWNIKVNNPDLGARGAGTCGETSNPAFHERWDAMVAHPASQIINDACENGFISFVFQMIADGHQFHTAGRSGGHMVLVSMNGKSRTFGDRAELREWLEDEYTKDDTLRDLYALLVRTGKLLAEPDVEVSYHINCIREQYEDSWMEYRQALPPDERQAIEAAEAAGARFIFANSAPDGMSRHGYIVLNVPEPQEPAADHKAAPAREPVADEYGHPLVFTTEAEAARHFLDHVMAPPPPDSSPAP